MDKTILLDFDGVICNSMQECLITSWNAFHKCFIHTTDEIPNKYCSFFYKNRSFIRPAKEYFILYKSYEISSSFLLNQNIFKQLLNKYKLEMINFEKDFFYKRKLLKKTDGWLQLHSLYNNVKNFLENHDDKFFIVTTKDRDSVELLLNHFNIKDRVINIYSKENGENKRYLINKLKSENSERIKNTTLLFVDDNEEHLKDVEDFRIELYLASWGYLIEEDQLHFNKISNLTEIL